MKNKKNKVEFAVIILNESDLTFTYLSLHDRSLSPPKGTRLIKRTSSTPIIPILKTKTH